MECYRCGTVVDGEDFCPNCGADIGLYRRKISHTGQEPSGSGVF